MSSTTQKKVAVSTLGCRANQYDSAALMGMLAQAGWQLVGFEEKADAYIINSCTVTNKADSEARQLVRKAHRQNPESNIIVTGCYAQTDPQALAGVEGVSFILGNDQKGSLLDYLERVQPLVPEIVVNDLFKEEKIFTHDFDSFSDRSRAYLKIQDGCNQMCSYCVIPFARGKNRSLSPDWVIQELRKLREKGFEEAVLTGIHIGTYGRDLNPETDLLRLMGRIEEEKPIHRVRLSSIDPEEVEGEMIQFLSRSEVFCPYLHIPVQSGEDHILRLMRRRYTADEFRRLCFTLKEKIPEICLGTDIMVGFPYEDEERFEASYRLMEALPLDYLHVFPYSPKNKTRAAKFLHQVSPSDKKERVRRMSGLSRAKKERFYRSAVGSAAEVILEEASPKELPDYVKGVSRNYIPVHVPARGGMPKGLARVRIDRYQGGQVFGEVIEGR
ncbi:MAG: tRNA (N(6)-L-threonylcarbamoyladenosine(37)-C(2))-methylthiotransferase MtaB [bacterium]